MLRTLAALTITVALSAGCGGPGTSGPPTPAGTSNERPADRGADDPAESYGDVVPSDAASDDGLFAVHHVDDDYLFEIPDSLLGRDMLLISRVAGVQAGMGGFLPAGASVNEQMVRFERVDDRILLRKYSGEAVADDSLAISRSVQANYFAPILAAFDIEARGARRRLLGGRRHRFLRG